MASYNDDDYEPIPPAPLRTFSAINIDSGDTVETFDTVEDAEEFINIHRDAENLAVMDDSNGSFVD